ncbi:hypothetical protein DOS84_13125 [Flavobacterium aquariorum]|uniref:Thoeris protein ThsB TIR-like domain-containing protein n=1 Tax=Flavobacterium aquariorum TaxID=2217670 RepID=A0A2W7TVN7_9FLAO|nr:TIR domain-containing protein [Flavobacterium aquariorum]PZX92810.1 hypothetical protein DOS84_13125 [Flavobacterium aquariorum]
MGKNIFVSYKYADTLVNSLRKREFAYVNGQFITRDRLTRVRDYVDELQSILDDEDHINLGEKDGESLKDFSEGYIQSSLKDKIYRSSITIVMISKGMVERYSPEKDQWIPWEISYSLKEVTRNDRTSRMNAVLGIVLPDENNSYEWYYTENPACNCTSHHTDKLFNILSRNMFNMKNPTESSCNGLIIHHGDFSFIKTVKWSDFKSYPNTYLNKAIEIREAKDNYNITKTV